MDERVGIELPEGYPHFGVTIGVIIHWLKSICDISATAEHLQLTTTTATNNKCLKVLQGDQVVEEVQFLSGNYQAIKMQLTTKTLRFTSCCFIFRAFLIALLPAAVHTRSTRQRRHAGDFMRPLREVRELSSDGIMFLRHLTNLQKYPYLDRVCVKSTHTHRVNYHDTNSVERLFIDIAQMRALMEFTRQRALGGSLVHKTMRRVVHEGRKVLGFHRVYGGGSSGVCFTVQRTNCGRTSTLLRTLMDTFIRMILVTNEFQS